VEITFAKNEIFFTSAVLCPKLGENVSCNVILHYKYEKNIKINSFYIRFLKLYILIQILWNLLLQTGTYLFN